MRTILGVIALGVAVVAFALLPEIMLFATYDRAPQPWRDNYRAGDALPDQPPAPRLVLRSDAGETIREGRCGDLPCAVLTDDQGDRFCITKGIGLDRDCNGEHDDESFDCDLVFIGGRIVDGRFGADHVDEHRARH